MSKPPTQPGRRRRAWIGPLCVLGAAVGFSAKAIFVKLAYPYGVGAITLLSLRMLCALPFFLAMAWYAKPPAAGTRWSIQDRLAVAGLGLLGYYLSSVLDFYGLLYISVSLERLILFLYPTLVLLFAAFVQRQPIGRRQWLALLLSYGGIGLAFWYDLRWGQRESVVLGSVLVFGAALTYAGYILGSGRYIRRLGVGRFTGWAMIAATGGVLLHFFSLHTPADLLQPTPVLVLALLMALLGTVMPSFLLSEGLQRIGAGRTALLSTFGPVATLALGHWILGDTVSVWQLAGAGLVIVGVGLVTVRHD